MTLQSHRDAVTVGKACVSMVRALISLTALTASQSILLLVTVAQNCPKIALESRCLVSVFYFHTQWLELSAGSRSSLSEAHTGNLPRPF